MIDINDVYVGIHVLFFFTGVTGNLFILIVQFLDWHRTHDHNPCNPIINSIGIFNIMLQGMVVFQEIAFFKFQSFYSQNTVTNIIVAIITSLTFSSIWCSTCLCYYYCVKIVNLNGTLFYKLKAKLPIMVPWILFLSIVLSWCVGMSGYWDLYNDVSVTSFNITGNMTVITSSSYVSRCKCMFQIYMFVASVAFSIIFITAGSILTSLFRHMRRMRQKDEGFGHSKITSHVSAAKTVTSLLIIYLIFYSAFTFLNYSLIVMNNLTITLCLMMISSFPTVNSIIIILGNRKLTNAIKKLLGMNSSVSNTEITVTAS